MLERERTTVHDDFDLFATTICDDDGYEVRLGRDDGTRFVTGNKRWGESLFPALACTREDVRVTK